MTTQEQKQIIAEYIEERAWDIATLGEVRGNEVISVEDIDGQDIEISVSLEGNCWERNTGYDVPMEQKIDIWYNGKADIYEKDALLYTLPVAGRIIDTI